MRELGVDLSAIRPRQLTDELAVDVSMLVTMGCGEACPVVPGAVRADWALEDPKGQSLERVREIRNAIAFRVRDLLRENDWLPWTIRDAQPADRPRAENLLRAASLPTEGVADHFATFTVAMDAAAHLAGVAGVELYGNAALLRSVAVDQSARKRGIGSILAERALAKARGFGASEVFLLTTTAEGFFERIARSVVPPGVATSTEFNGICPDSAALLRRRV